MEVCNCSMFCCTLLYVHSSIAIILMGKRELIALLNLSSWCLVMVERLFLAVPRGCLRFVIVVFPDHTHLLFLYEVNFIKKSTKSIMDHSFQKLLLNICFVYFRFFCWKSIFALTEAIATKTNKRVSLRLLHVCTCTISAVKLFS